MRLQGKWLVMILLLCPYSIHAMGLRSFVALPLEKSGAVVRFQFERNMDRNKEILVANLAYGLSGKQTLLLSIPYRISPSGSDRLGDVSALYRHILWQVDKRDATYRLALLGGAVINTDSDRDGKLQAGIVTTFYLDRHEIDLDLIGRKGLGQDPDTAQYDLSYQYRLTPAEYPEMGLGSQWNIVTELNGRFQENEQPVHQATLGMQWIHPSWVLEGGIIKNLSANHDKSFILSARVHI